MSTSYLVHYDMVKTGTKVLGEEFNFFFLPVFPPLPFSIPHCVSIIHEFSVFTGDGSRSESPGALHPQVQ